jgi:hypothetical protein
VRGNGKKNTRADLHSTGVPDAEEPVGHGSTHEPEKPSFKSNLIVFIKILAIAGGIILLIWFLDKNVSGG